jgi:hypothetical protein
MSKVKRAIEDWLVKTEQELEDVQERVEKFNEKMDELIFGGIE